MTHSPQETKAQIRSRMRSIIRGMSDEQRRIASSNACARLCGLEAFEHAGVVMMYMPLANEIDITPAALRCFQRGKSVCVPKVDWARGEMNPVEITSLDDHVLDCDEHGLRSPKICRPVLPTTIDLVVVPGLAFDPQGNRLGRGGGYYDRFLRRLKPGVTTVGLVFDQQIIDAVPAEESDVAVDIVVSDRRVTFAKPARTA
jgi:5-formyltetrahydrofolate cyclo-ligase